MMSDESYRNRNRDDRDRCLQAAVPQDFTATGGFLLLGVLARSYGVKTSRREVRTPVE